MSFVDADFATRSLCFQNLDCQDDGPKNVNSIPISSNAATACPNSRHKPVIAAAFVCPPGFTCGGCSIAPKISTPSFSRRIRRISE